MFLTTISAGDSSDRSPYGGFWFNPVPSRGGADTSGDNALKLSAVYACVRVLAESLAILPLKLYKQGDKRKQIRSHWLLTLLNRKPNPWQTPFEWREMMMGHLAMRGNAYNEIVTNRQGQIVQLTPMNPDRMKVEMVDDGTDWGYRYRYTDRKGAEHVFLRDEIWHIRGLSSDGIMGLSPLSVAAASVGIGLAAQDYGARFFQNDAKPGGGWIEYPGNFKDKASRDVFRESWQSAHTGASRGKIGVLEFGMKFHELGLTNVDSQFLEARQFQIGDIARFFRIPPHKIGDLSKATFSNIEQQSLEFVIDTMTPWAERWESSIETHLLGDEAELVEPEFDFVRLLRGDQAARGAWYNLGINGGWMTRAEPRKVEGFPPIKGLDRPLLPLNMVLLDAEGNPPAPPKPAPSLPPPKGDPGDPPPGPKTPPAKQGRLVLMAQAAVERVARKEAKVVAVSKNLETAYQDHEGFVASVLAISEDAAKAYCTRRAQEVVGMGGELVYSSAYEELVMLALTEDDA